MERKRGYNRTNAADSFRKLVPEVGDNNSVTAAEMKAAVRRSAALLNYYDSACGCLCVCVRMFKVHGAWAAEAITGCPAGG
jgi:hypothetical protein